jgi:hypothetical protein
LNDAQQNDRWRYPLSEKIFITGPSSKRQIDVKKAAGFSSGLAQYAVI